MKENMDTALLTEILASINAILAAVQAYGTHNSVTGNNSIAVSSGSPYNQAANPQLVGISITNLGSANVSVEMGTYIVAVLEQYETYISPDIPSDAVAVTCASSSTIAVCNRIRS